MNRGGGRRARYFFGLLLAASPAAASEPALEVALSCRPEPAPGRVLCELNYRVGAEGRLTWADALVTAAPDFARPLRSRVAPERFGATSSAERRLTLAFVATRAGVGRVTVRARAVVCHGEGAAERCRPRSAQVSAELRVGS